MNTIKSSKLSTEFVVSVLVSMKDQDYLLKTLEGRIPGPESHGSTFSGDFETSQEVLEVLLLAWWEAYDHPEIRFPCRGFITKDLKGILGVGSIWDLPDQVFRVEDPKGTGKLTPVTLMEGTKIHKVDFTVLVIGPMESDPSSPEVWTVHPGNPIRPSSLTYAQGGNPGDLISRHRLLELGMTHVKLR